MLRIWAWGYCQNIRDKRNQNLRSRHSVL